MTLTWDSQFVGESSALIQFLRDERVTDILINGVSELFVERNGEMIEEPNPFSDHKKLSGLIERLVIPIGKRLDARYPFLDGEIPQDGRFHIAFPPLCKSGPVISIRVPRRRGALGLNDFAPPEIVDYLEKRVKSRKNILIVGGTGSGKTTLLEVLIRSVPSHERILLLEESAELKLPGHHVVSLVARPESPDGTAEVTLRQLVRNGLRMRPDRILLGEVRGAEAFDLLSALNSGHLGSMGTIHANQAVAGLRRLEALASLGAPGAPILVIREWVAQSVHTVVSVERDDSNRRVKEIIEIHGMEGERLRILPVSIG